MFSSIKNWKATNGKMNNNNDDDMKRNKFSLTPRWHATSMSQSMFTSLNSKKRNPHAMQLVLWSKENYTMSNRQTIKRYMAGHTLLSCFPIFPGLNSPSMNALIQHLFFGKRPANQPFVHHQYVGHMVRLHARKSSINLCLE